MNLPLFIFLIFVLQIICLIVGNRVSKNMKDQKDYFLAGKTIKFFPLMMTFIATQIGGGLVLGSAEEAYQWGASVLFYPLGAALGLILLASGIGKLMSRFKVSTVAQIYEVAYRSTFLKKIASILSIASLFMIFIAQIIASRKFMLSVGFDQNLLFIAFWAIVIIYTVLGGLKAVVATDIIQALFFIFAFILCFVFIFANRSSSLEIPLNSFAVDGQKVLGWLLMPMLFMVIEQDMAQRCFAASSPKTVTKATFWAAMITMLICFIPVLLGMLTKKMGIAIPQGASVLMTIIQTTTNPTISAIVGCAIIAAIISTADSLINAISSNLAQDFSFNKKSLKSSQCLTAIIGIIGILFSFFFDNIVGLLIQSYELSVSCLFASIFIALFKKNCRFASALASIMTGAVCFILFRFYQTPIPKELLSVSASLIAYFCTDFVFAYQFKRSKISL